MSCIKYDHFMNNNALTSLSEQFFVDGTYYVFFERKLISFFFFFSYRKPVRSFTDIRIKITLKMKLLIITKTNNRRSSRLIGFLCQTGKLSGGALNTPKEFRLSSFHAILPKPRTLTLIKFGVFFFPASNFQS